MEAFKPELKLLTGLATGSRWLQSHDSNGRLSFSRPLGLLERKFDNAAFTVFDPEDGESGQSDTFLKLDVTTTGKEASEELFRRLPLAWARLRARHPPLAYTVNDVEVLEENSTEHIEIPGPRAFRYEPPMTDAEALQGAAATLLVSEHDDAEDLKATVAETLATKVVNGPRAFLSQDGCLARLLFFRNVSAGDGDGHHTHVFLLSIAHVISDGQSVMQITRELFSSLELPNLPTPPTTFPFRSLRDFLAEPAATFDLFPYASSATETCKAWGIRLPTNEISAMLPLSSEEHYPSLPISDPTAIPAKPNLNRRRWFWAISHAATEAAYSLMPPTHFLPRIGGATPTKPVTSWPKFAFEKDESSALIQIARSNGVTATTLLYGVISIALANIFQRLDPSADYKPILLQFPISFRRFLDSSTPSTQADLAIRINFNYLSLPNMPQDFSDGRRLHWTAVQNAKLATRQFAERFNPAPHTRALFLARSYRMVWDKMRVSLGLGADAQVIPRGALTASMVGNVDAILPTSFTLPTLSPFRLSDMLLGTRLHLGEGTLTEIFTFEGRITFCLGFDKTCVSPALVDEILHEVELVGNALIQYNK